MTQQQKHAFVLVLLILPALLFTTAFTVGQAGGVYDLSWWTVDGGGGESTGGDYSLVATFGQPDATGLSASGGTMAAVGQPDAPTLNGGDYTLIGGFLSDIDGEYELYLPVMLGNE